MLINISNVKKSRTLELVKTIQVIQISEFHKRNYVPLSLHLIGRKKLFINDFYYLQGQNLKTNI